MLISYAGGVAGRGTPNNPGPSQIAGSASLAFGANGNGAAINALTWTANLPNPLNVAPNGYFDLAPYFTGAPGNITANPSLPANVSVINSPTWRVFASSAAVPGASVANVAFTLVPDAVADWLSRISGSGVVWYHNFDSAAEVNNFRWTAGVGVDPNRVSAYQANYVASGGADGGGYMQITRPAGTTEPSDWWRPFSPLTASSNGRGVADPGANGTLTPQAWNSANTNQLANWASLAKPGWYGNAANQNSFFDGTEFYLQMRVMADPRSSQLAGDGSAHTLTGKFFYLTSTINSNTAQELVTIQRYIDPNVSGIGAPNYHNVYGHNPGGSADYLSWFATSPPPSGTRIQRGSAIPGVCDPYGHSTGGCWAYALDGTWDTIMYRIQPGTSGSANTLITVYAAHSGETSFTTIMDVTVPISYDSGGLARPGWNALLCSGYNNGFTGITYPEFWTRFDQIIFSKNVIPCPQV